MVFCTAHRGASFHEPENTLTAVKAAIKLRADYVEVDVRKCKSGELVVIHDETVDRTTDGAGKVSNLTLRQLKNLCLAFGEKIPTLVEVSEAVKGKIKLVVELKELELEEKALSTIVDAGIIEDAIFVSFHHGSIRRLKQLNPEANGGIIVRSGLISPVKAALECGVTYLFQHYRYINAETLAEAKNKGIKVVAWTIDHKDLAEKIRLLGVNGIATNRPEIITGEKLYRKPRAYLAGPVKGLEKKQEYRVNLAEILKKYGFEVFDPLLREKKFYAGMTYKDAFKLAKRDLLDLEYCELIVAYLPKVSAGTAIELYHAKTKGRKTVLICRDVSDLSPWFKAYSDEIFKSIDEFEEALEAGRLISF
jgi:glycerophosphoryl diester phosphodiesterase